MFRSFNFCRWLSPAGAPAYDVGEIIQSGSVYVLLQINRAWHFSVMVLNVHWDLGDVFALVYSCVLWSVEWMTSPNGFSPALLSGAICWLNCEWEMLWAHPVARAHWCVDPWGWGCTLCNWKCCVLDKTSYCFYLVAFMRRSDFRVAHQPDDDLWVVTVGF